MISKNQFSKKLIAIILAILMVISSIPVVIFSAFAADGNDCIAIKVGTDEKIVYFYGADSVEVNDLTVKYTGGDENVVSVFAGGSSEIDTTDIVLAKHSITFTENWLEAQVGWIAVQCSEEANVPALEPSVDVDEIAPTITKVTGNPTDWTKNDATLSVVATDAGTGIISYSNDGLIWQESADFTVDENGTYSFYAKDKSGNVSNKFEVVVGKIDKIAPTISSVAIDPDTWTNQDVTLVVTASDPDSGLADEAYKMDDGDWQASAEFTVSDSNNHTFYVRDVLGNEAKTTQNADKHDVVKPTISSVAITKKVGSTEKLYNSDSFTSSKINYTFTVTATDDKSGVCEYSNDGTTWQSSSSFVMKGAGTYTFYVKDNAGNVSSVYNVSLKGDDVKPTISNIALSTTEPTNQEITFTVTATDDAQGAGLAGKAYKMDNGEWQSSNEFKVSDCKEHTFYVRDASDAENIQSQTAQAANFCDKTPTISDVTLSTEAWTNAAVTVTVIPQGTTNDASVNFPIASYKMDDGSWQNVATFTIADAKEHIFIVKDTAGNESVASKKTVTNYDASKPILADGTAVSFEQKNEGKIASILNKLTFGKFFNKTLVVTVNAKDVADEINNASGIIEAKFTFVSFDKEDKYSFDAKSIGNKEESVIKFEVKNADLPENFKGTASVTLTDGAGNTETYAITTANSDMGGNESDYTFMIENDAPVITETTTPQINKTSYNFDFSVDDETESNYSGIAYVKVYANDVEVFAKDYQNDASMLSKNDYSLEAVAASEDSAKAYTVNGVALGDKWNDGEINYTVETCDNAGNYVTYTTEESYKFDQTSPVIKEYKIGTNNSNSIEVHNTYGFYFKEDVTVEITATDIVNSANKEMAASGVASITTYLEDVNGKKYYVPFNGAEIVELPSTMTVDHIAIDTTDKISFKIPEDFKGQIYSFATDAVGNCPASCVYFLDDTDVDSDGFVNPDGSIVEKTEMHIDTSSIKFIMPETNNTQNTVFEGYSQDNHTDKIMDYEAVASEKVALYSNDFKAGIVVEDNYSGIEQVRTTVIAGDSKTVKTVKVDNKGVLSGDTLTWTVENTDSNLVTKLAINDFAVEGNYNDMVLVVELTDRAGNVSYDYYAFGIDKTAPVITVSYDNNDADTKSNSNAYFKSNRTATITIKERNFNTENVNWIIKNAEGSAPTQSSAKFTQGTGNRDDDTYTYTVTYDYDGVFSFDMNYVDRAENNNLPIDYGESAAPISFIVDKTLPTINVSYDNNNSQNEKYFKEYRTSTITVKEHNFDVNRVVITGTASKDGTTQSFPSVSWKNSGDFHIATISYNVDGDYTFDITMDDMAGNKSNPANYGSSVAAKDFVVDTTIDKPMITGVENGNSYKDSVLPKIDFTDINFKDYKIVLTRTRKDEINKDVTADFINISSNDKGGSFAANEETFKKVQENDGIYTLSVEVTDKAENTSSDQVTFTVNRFGSVYTLGNFLVTDLNNKYVQSVNEDIVITEYNPNKLVNGSLDVVVTRDGSPVDYQNGELRVSPVVNEFAKIGSSGWYQYQYTISKSVFVDENGQAKDGIYKVYVGSEDSVGNKSENISYEDCEVMFRLDHTPPTIKSVSGLEKKIVNADELNVSYEIFDAIGMAEIIVEYNGKDGNRVTDRIAANGDNKENLTDVLSDLTSYSGNFTIGSSNGPEDVRIRIRDLAGNEIDTNDADFDIDSIDFNRQVTVSTNFFVRWYANKPLFWGSIAAVVVVAGGLAFFVATRRRRRDDARTEEIRRNARGSQE